MMVKAGRYSREDFSKSEEIYLSDCWIRLSYQLIEVGEEDSRSSLAHMLHKFFKSIFHPSIHLLHVDVEQIIMDDYSMHLPGSVVE